MGIMDSVKGLMGNNPQLHGFVEGLQTFVQQSGGINGLKSKFEKEAAGSVLQSWISTGPNLPISPEQIQKVMGSQFIHDIARKMDLEPSVATEKLSQMIPKIIDRLSPNGKLPDQIDAATLANAAANFKKEEHL